MTHVESFNPDRLTLARQRRGLTKVALALAAEVAPRTITQYERGAQVPRESTLERIAAALEYPEVYFSLESPDSPDAQATSFRALSRMSARTRDQALSFAATAVDLSNWISERFTTPAPDIPQLSDLPPSLAADALRREWALGAVPLPHAIDLLEAHGVRVFSLPQELDSVDANSFWRDDQPFVMLNRSKSSERSRFDVAHELGHLTMHDEHSAHGRDAEAQANEFASTLMMPEADIRAYAPTDPTLAELIQLKRRWGVSLSALTRRLYRLDLLSEWQYRAHFIDMSRKGYRKHEPNSLPMERSQVLDEVVARCDRRGITPRDIAHELSIPINDLQALIFGLEVLARSQLGTDSPTVHPPPHFRVVR